MFDDRDLLIRTLIGEAGNQDDVGKAAVAHVVMNRLKSGRFGSSIPDILFAPKQFEPWNTRRDELMGIRPDSPAYMKAGQIVDAVQGGQFEDPTKGATHFANVGTVQQRGNTAGMRWINEGLNNGSAVKIGAHTFMSPDSQPGANNSRPTGGTPMPSGMPQIMGGMGQEQGLPPILGGQQEQGGIAGMFNDPMKMAYMSMIVKGLNPWSEINPQQMLMQAQNMRVAQANQQYERQKDQRDYGLRERQFDVTRSDKDADNKRADAQFDFAKTQAGLTDIAKDLIGRGLKPGTNEYFAEYQKAWENKHGGKPTDDIREFEYAKKQGFTGSLEQWMQRKRGGAGEYGLNPVWGKDKDGNPALVQLGKSGDAISPKLPEGFSPSKGIEKIDLGDSWGFVDKQSGQTLRVVPKNIEDKEAAEERGKARGLAQVGLSSAITKVDYSLNLLDEMIKHPGRETATGLSSRLDPRNIIPGTDASDFAIRAKQVEGRAFLEAFESLKGGGAITEIEGAKATQAIGRLDRAQSDAEYKKALAELQGILKQGRDNLLKKASGNFGQTGTVPTPAAGVAAPDPLGIR
jgi:hypothetical protein